LAPHTLNVDPLNNHCPEAAGDGLADAPRFDKVESAAHEAIEARPDEPTLMVQLGYVHDDQANYEAALKWASPVARTPDLRWLRPGLWRWFTIILRRALD
jgi:hypothetical protein